MKTQSLQEMQLSGRDCAKRYGKILGPLINFLVWLIFNYTFTIVICVRMLISPRS